MTDLERAVGAFHPEQNGQKVSGGLEQFPDDAALVESAGYCVTMIPGDPLNLKVTTREDLLLAEAILKRSVRRLSHQQSAISRQREMLMADR